MRFYIKEWPNKTATLMTCNGSVLWTFCSVKEALDVCKEWYKVQEANTLRDNTQHNHTRRNNVQHDYDDALYDFDGSDYDPASACIMVG